MYVWEDLALIHIYLETKLCYKYVDRNPYQKIEGDSFQDNDIIVVVYDSIRDSMKHIKLKTNRIGSYIKIKGHRYYLTNVELKNIKEIL
ncbi:MAG: hypothetical protein ACRC1T_09615 [Clostridium chrysemydis]|uniref:hypothetical protein n=1 Tax=Clostridium chrysemydis TaxID=2665504 RepID=UPI003F4079D5